jgi:hypothetical protein
MERDGLAKTQAVSLTRTRYVNLEFRPLTNGVCLKACRYIMCSNPLDH